MKIACFVYASESRLEGLSTEEEAALSGRYGTLLRELQDSGAFAGGERLLPAATATTVRVRDGEVLVTDGPFAETREELGGLFLLDCDTVDEAVEIARRVPAADHGAVEVRPQYERGAA